MFSSSDGQTVVRIHRVNGTNEDDGGPETATIVLRENPEWSPEESQTEFRYHTFYFFDDPEEEIEFGGYDVVAEAEARFLQLKTELEQEYRDRAERLQRGRALELFDISAEWADGPEKELVYSIGILFERGQIETILDLVRLKAEKISNRHRFESQQRD